MKIRLKCGHCGLIGDQSKDPSEHPCNDSETHKASSKSSVPKIC